MQKNDSHKSKYYIVDKIKFSIIKFLIKIFLAPTRSRWWNFHSMWVELGKRLTNSAPGKFFYCIVNMGNSKCPARPSSDKTVQARKCHVWVILVWWYSFLECKPGVRVWAWVSNAFRIEACSLITKAAGGQNLASNKQYSLESVCSFYRKITNFLAHLKICLTKLIFTHRYRSYDGVDFPLAVSWVRLPASLIPRLELSTKVPFPYDLLSGWEVNLSWMITMLVFKFWTFHKFEPEVSQSTRAGFHC